MTSYIAEAADLVRARVSEIKGRPTATDQRLMLGYAALALPAARGQEVTWEDVHDQWSVFAGQVMTGHADLVPAGQLSDAVRDRDRPYLTAILDVGAQLAAEHAMTGEQS